MAGRGPTLPVSSWPGAAEPVSGWRQVSTPWVLDATSDHRFVARFLRERVDAAVEHEPTLGPAGATWLRRRLAQLDDPGTRITVGHRDLLLLP